MKWVGPMGVQTLEMMAPHVRELARKPGGASVSAFGSFIHGTADADSDLDLRVEMAPGRDLLDLIALKQELELRLGIRVDGGTKDGLSPYLREKIFKEARRL